MERFDFTIIGGGIFGVYSAIYLAEKGAKVCLIEKEKELFSKASTVNQARIHAGYHYPRSIATAQLSEEYKARFISEHRDFINDSFEHFYAIDRYNSVTNAAQFERFCNHLKIPCKRISEHSFFKKNRVEALFKTEELSFDPILIGNFYKEKLTRFKNISLLKNTQTSGVKRYKNHFGLNLQNIDNQLITKIESSNIINATYSETNSVLKLFDLPEIELTHELVEMVFVKNNQNIDFGLTVMDGQFCSMMPYGLSGLHSLSSVAYTPHEVSKNNLPKFKCQEINKNCTALFLKNCNECAARPSTNFSKMKSQIQQYLNEKIELEYVQSKFTIKSKLKSSHIDDSRPTQIQKLSENPGFYCIFAGKINSIYEIEKMINF